MVVESVADVVRAVGFARSHGMRIAPQGTGHGAVPLEPLEGVMLLKTSRPRDVKIYPGTRNARVEAGAIWQDVTVPGEQARSGLPAGSSPNVGVTGYTLGGGISWLARRYGLAANGVTAVEAGRLPMVASRSPTPTTSRTCSGLSEAGAAVSAWLRHSRRPCTRSARYVGSVFLPDPTQLGGPGRLAPVDRHAA